MKGNVTKVLATFAFVASIALINVGPAAIYAAPDTCTWTGATSNSWATGSNWSGCDNGGIPEDGDSLVFPETAQNKTMSNNLSSLDLFAINSMTFNGTGYTLNGNGFTITGITAITANESATINVDLTYNSGSHINILPASGRWLTITGTTTFALTSFYEVNVGSPSFTGSVDFQGNISGDAAAQFIAVNGATAQVSGSSNTFQADLVGAEAGGNFRCDSATCFGDNSNDIYMGGGIVDITVPSIFTNDFITSTSSDDISAITATQNTVISGNGTVNDDMLAIQQSSGRGLSFHGTITLNGSVETETPDMTSLIIFDGAISGAGNVTVNSGQTVLSASNTYTGTTTAKSGAVIQADQTNSLGSTSAPTIIEDGASLQLNALGNTAIAEPLQIAGEGASTGQHRGAVYISEDSNHGFILSGNIILTDDATFYNGLTGYTMELSGIISGPHDVTYTGAAGANFDITGSSPNTYTGTTTMSGAMLCAYKTLAIPTDLIIDSTDPVNNSAAVAVYGDDSIADSATVTIGNTTDRLHIGQAGDAEVIGGLIGAGILSLAANDSRLIVDQDFNSTFAGDIRAYNQPGELIKRGTGNLLLTGSMESSTDDDVKFIVEEGTLTVNGDLTTTDGTLMEIKDNGTLKGNGKVGKVSTSGGTLAPGTSPGKLTVNSLTLDATNTVEFELDGPVAGTSYDQIESSGAIDIADATLSLIPGYTPSAGQVFTIITGTSVTGTFKDLSNNSTIAINGLTFRVNYSPTTVTLTYVSGAYTASSSGGILANTGTSMLLAAIASLVLIAAATVLITRRKHQVSV